MANKAYACSRMGAELTKVEGEALHAGHLHVCLAGQRQRWPERSRARTSSRLCSRACVAARMEAGRAKMGDEAQKAR